MGWGGREASPPKHTCSPPPPPPPKKKEGGGKKEKKEREREKARERDTEREREREPKFLNGTLAISRAYKLRRKKRHVTASIVACVPSKSQTKGENSNTCLYEWCSPETANAQKGSSILISIWPAMLLALSHTMALRLTWAHEGEVLSSICT